MTSTLLDSAKLQSFVGATWEETIVPTLVDYIRIPNKSPIFDPSWSEHGHMARATKLVESWCRAQPIAGMTVEVVEIPGRTPLIFMEIPATPGVSGTVMLYGHLDKQPEMTGWREGLGPWVPVLEGDKLYGRGGADDGYAAFASLTAIRGLQLTGGKHARCVILIEACEESGSFDLPHYIEKLAPRIGQVDLVVCLDSGCANYDQLWSTTSLRGMMAATLRVDILTEGVHSGDASGVVPSSFRILRQLLSRVEDETTGKLKLPELYVEIPEGRIGQAKAVAKAIGPDIAGKFPWVQGAQPMGTDVPELVLSRTWRPTLSVTGVEGIPPLQNAGNVLRPYTTLMLSFRLPPSCDPEKAVAVLERTLTKDPPYGAKVTFASEKAAAGWDAPALAPWLERAADEASRAFFGKPAMYMGEGGSIPFMGMLGEKFPEAQFLITGVLGPGSNAHGPNEFLHVPTGKKLTASVALVLARHAQERS